MEEKDVKYLLLSLRTELTFRRSDNTVETFALEGVAGVVLAFNTYEEAQEYNTKGYYQIIPIVLSDPKKSDQ